MVSSVQNSSVNTLTVTNNVTVTQKQEKNNPQVQTKTEINTQDNLKVGIKSGVATTNIKIENKDSHGLKNNSYEVIQDKMSISDFKAGVVPIAKVVGAGLLFGGASKLAYSIHTASKVSGLAILGVPVLAASIGTAAGVISVSKINRPEAIVFGVGAGAIAGGLIGRYSGSLTLSLVGLTLGGASAAASGFYEGWKK